MKPPRMRSPTPNDPPPNPPSQRRSRARIYPRVASELAHRLARHATASGVTETAIVEAALEQYLDRTSDMALVLDRLDRTGRACGRLQRDLVFLSEAFAVFVKIWFAHTPSIPEDGRQAARATAEARYRKWLDHVVEQFSGGRRFIDDLPSEPIADDVALAAVAQGTLEPEPERHSE